MIAPEIGKLYLLKSWKEIQDEDIANIGLDEEDYGIIVKCCKSKYDSVTYSFFASNGFFYDRRAIKKEFPTYIELEDLT